MTSAENRVSKMMKSNNDKDLLLDYIKNVITDQMLAMHVSSWLISKYIFSDSDRYTKILKSITCIRYTSKTQTARVYFIDKSFGLKQSSSYKPGSYFKKSIIVRNPYFDPEFSKEI